jgi:excisionase family DNA binding protein
MNDPTEALTIPETCAESRIGRTKIYEAINEGLLPAKKLGRKTIILRSDLRQFLAALPNIREPPSIRDGPPERPNAQRSRHAGRGRVRDSNAPRRVLQSRR